jgi:hypothetical protein
MQQWRASGSASPPKHALARAASCRRLKTPAAIKAPAGLDVNPLASDGPPHADAEGLPMPMQKAHVCVGRFPRPC